MPGVTKPTVNPVPVRDEGEPPLRTQTGEVIIAPVPEIAHVVSPAPNPLPLMVTIVPRIPELGVRVIEGPVTVNVAIALSPLLPVTVIV